MLSLWKTISKIEHVFRNTGKVVTCQLEGFFEAGVSFTTTTLGER